MSIVRAVLFSLAAILSAAGVSSEELCRLIRNGDAAGLSAALAKGADINAKDSHGVTPLLCSAVVGSADEMKLLIDAGADVNAKNTFGATALLWSAGDVRKVRMLVDKGADVNAATKQGRTPLMVAASQAGNEEAVRLLLAKGADPKVKDGFQTTALHCATQSNDTSLIRLLVEKGVDVNAKNVPALTPLMGAAAQGNLAAVKLLLSKGADVNAVSSEKGQPVKNGPIALGKLTPLMLSVAYGPAELVKTLLDAGADVNARDVRGMTPLMLSVSSETQDPEVVRMLLKKGADASAKSLSGETALDWAKKFHSAPVLQLLHGGEPLTDPTPARTADATDLRKQVEKSIALLQRSSTEFFKQSGCVGCHHQNITAFAVHAARGKGIAIDEEAMAEQTKTVKFGWAGFQEMLLQRIDAPGGADMVNYSLLGMAAANYPADPITDAMASNLASSQSTDGSWHQGGFSRAPMEESDVSRTAMALHSLQIYGPPARRAELHARIERAKAWLIEVKVRNNEERNLQLLGLTWAKADEATLRRLSKALLAGQRADGGWSSKPNVPSDAYATGQSLYALHAAGLQTRDGAYQRGVRYLLATQREDGSWHVRSRAPKFQPYFQSGFPYDHDQWISSVATGWASMGLALAIDSQSAHL